MQKHLTDGNVVEYLQGRGLLEPGEEARVEAAGDGNINWVRRIHVPGRPVSWILKQARPALERFPEYQVSTERIVFEARYYEEVAPYDGEGVSPRILHFDLDARVLLMEDLGQAERLDHALARGADVSAALSRLAAFLGRVHAATAGREAELAPRFANGEMQRLHGDHIFQLPFRENEFPLSPALAARARQLWVDAALVAAADTAYARYLEPRGALVHADVQAGNVLLAARGPVLLDAEIAHVGDPLFDMGTLLAHVELAGAGGPASAAAWHAYCEARGTAPPFAPCARYLGLEMLRRSVGAARVAAVEKDDAGLRAIEQGRRLVTAPPDGPEGLAG